MPQPEVFRPHYDSVWDDPKRGMSTDPSQTMFSFLTTQTKELDVYTNLGHMIDGSICLDDVKYEKKVTPQIVF